MMLKKISLMIAIAVFFFCGCETVRDGAKKGGEALGKGGRVVGGISEGAMDGYMGEDEGENPYDR